MTAPTTNRILEIVTTFIKEQDVTRAVAQLTDDVHFSGPLISVQGKAAYRGLLEQFLSAHVETRILEQFAGEASACSINELVVRTPSGAQLTVPMAEWFRLRGNLVAEHRVFYDPRDFGRAFGLC